MLEYDEELRPYVSAWDVTERQINVRRCAGLLREISSHLLDGDLNGTAVVELAGVLASARDLSVESGRTEEEPPGVPGAEIHPWVGPSNAIAPPMQFHLEDEVLVGQVRCSELYGGSAGRVHGGVIAGLFDAVLATRSALSGASMTARLVVDFRTPVPLNEPLRLEATVDRIEGRKCFSSARLYHGTTLCAEAEALMISARSA